MLFDLVVSSDPPSVDLAVSELPSGTTQVTVTRLWAGTSARVRGDSHAVVTGLAARVVDWEAPTERDVTYRVDAFSSSGGFLGTATTSPASKITHGDRSTVWLSDPLAPSLTVRLVAMAPSDDRRTYLSGVTGVQPSGVSAPIAVGGGQRQAGSGWPWILRCDDHDAADALEQLTLPGGTLLIRPHPDWIRHRTGLIYFAAPSITEAPRHDSADKPHSSDWTLTGFEARPPGASVVMPARTYADLLPEAATYADLVSVYGSYLDVLRGS